MLILTRMKFGVLPQAARQLSAWRVINFCEFVLVAFCRRGMKMSSNFCSCSQWFASNIRPLGVVLDGRSTTQVVKSERSSSLSHHFRVSMERQDGYQH